MSNRWGFACVLFAVTQLLNFAGAQQATTESGTISGVTTSGTTVYKGVPFAAPPVGALRWRPPIQAVPWTGTRKADAV